MSALTIEQRLDLIEASGIVGWRLVWDGCHKIYILTDRDSEEEVRDQNYDVPEDIYPASQIRDLWERSCGLRFVHMWSVDLHGAEGRDLPWNIDQCEED